MAHFRTLNFLQEIPVMEIYNLIFYKAVLIVTTYTLVTQLFTFAPVLFHPPTKSTSWGDQKDADGHDYTHD